MSANEKILITGASGYLGNGLCEYFTKAGFQVIGISNSNAGLFPTLKADLSKPGSAKELLSEVKKVHGNIDHIINNAARQDVALLKDETPEQISQFFQVNVSAIAEIYAEVAKTNYGVKSVINISSIEAVSPRPGHAVYGATKAALEALTKSAAVEIAPIRSNFLRLGLIGREGIESAWPQGVSAWQSAAPLKAMGKIDDVAKAIEYLLHANWVTGSGITLDGGISVTANW